MYECVRFPGTSEAWKNLGDFCVMRFRWKGLNYLICRAQAQRSLLFVQHLWKPSLGKVFDIFFRFGIKYHKTIMAGENASLYELPSLSSPPSRYTFLHSKAFTFSQVVRC